jgi:hypothetical protein
VHPEVRAVYDPFDDPTMPVGSIRAWPLGKLDDILQGASNATLREVLTESCGVGLLWAMGIAALN